MEQNASDDVELIEVADVRKRVPWWPYSDHGTYRLIRAGRLGAVIVGSRRFLTRRLLREFIATHTVAAKAG